MEQITLYPSKAKWLLLAAVSLIFVAGGVLVLAINGPVWIAWSSIVFFGVCAAIAMTQLLPHSGWLKLEEDGFSYRSLYRTHSYQWLDIEALGTANVSGHWLVVFEAGKTGKLADMNRQLSGADQALPDTYGMSVDELALLMSQYHLHALSKAEQV